MTAPPSTTSKPDPARKETAHRARFGSESAWAAPRRAEPRPGAPTSAEIVATRDHPRATTPTTTSSPTASSAAAPASPGRRPRRTSSGSQGRSKKGPSTSGSSRTTGRSARTTAASGRRTPGPTTERASTRNGPGGREPDAEGDGEEVAAPPGRQRPGEALRDQTRPVLAVGGDVDHRLADADPGEEDEEGQAEEGHQREERGAGDEVSAGEEEPQRGAGADGLPAGAVDSGSTSHARTTGAPTRSSAATPVTSPMTTPRHHGGVGTASVFAGLPVGQRGAKAVDDGHRPQCAGGRHGLVRAHAGAGVIRSVRPTREPGRALPTESPPAGNLPVGRAPFRGTPKSAGPRGGGVSASVRRRGTA